MRVQVIAFSLAVLVSGAFAAAPPSITPLPAGAAAREAKLMAHMGPQARAFSVREGRREARNGEMSEGVALAAARAYGPSLGASSDADIEALAFIVLMEAAKSSQDDLKSVMAEVQAVNATKAKQRQAHAQAAAVKTAVHDQLDSQGELGETVQLRLQMVTDRRKQAAETLSNIMKKFSDTQSTIISNLK